MRKLIVYLITTIIFNLTLPVSAQQLYASSGKKDNKWRKTGGVHELTTNPSSDNIAWKFTWSDRVEIHYENKIFSGIESFKTFFLQEGFSKQAHIEIIGIWNSPVEPKTNRVQNEALLKFIRDAGFEEANYSALKKKWPNGIYSVYWWHKDDKIAWTYTGISKNKLINRYVHSFDIEGFKEEFSKYSHNRLAKIIVSYYPNSSHAEEAKAIYKFLKQQGYQSIQIELEDTN